MPFISIKSTFLRSLLLVSSFCFITNLSFGQLERNVTIGGGLIATNNIPFNGNANFGWTSMIFDNAGFHGSDQIIKIGFYVDNSPLNYVMQNQRIWMRLTNASVHTSANYPGTAGFIKVYDGPITYNGAGWSIITLQTPFAYNIAQNLEVLCENGDGSKAPGFPVFRYIDAGANRVVRDFADAGFPTGAGTIVTARPNTKFIFPTPANTNCLTNTPATDFCSAAPLINNLNGYCGNTKSTYTVSPSDPSGSAFCGNLENTSWLKFIASETTARLNIIVDNCNDNNGIQMRIYETTNCGSGTFTPRSNCWSPKVVQPGIIEATGLTPGNTYYLMIDGYAGDQCDYTIYINSGVQMALGGTYSKTDPSCASLNDGTISVTPIGGVKPYQSISLSGAATQTNTSGLFTGLGAGTYKVTITDLSAATFVIDNITLTAPTITFSAGKDKLVCGSKNYSLNATGTNGFWEVKSPNSSDISISNINDPKATVTTAGSCDAYMMVWNERLGACILKDTVWIGFENIPTCIPPSLTDCRPDIDTICQPAFLITPSNTQAGICPGVVQSNCIPTSLLKALKDSIAARNARVVCVPPTNSNTNCRWEWRFIGNFDTIVPKNPPTVKFIPDRFTENATVEPSEFGIYEFNWVCDVQCVVNCGLCELEPTDCVAGCGIKKPKYFALAKPSVSPPETVIRCSNDLPYFWEGLIINATGVYTKANTNKYGCDSSKILNFIAQPFTAINEGLVGICENGSPFIWYGQAITAPGVYKSIINCEERTIAVQLIPNRPPPQFDPIAPVCMGQSFTLPTTSLDGRSGYWDPAENSMVTTTYRFFENSMGQCDQIAQITVPVIPLPNASAGPSVPSICLGAFSSPMGGSVSGGATGIWSGGLGSWINANDPANAVYVPAPVENGPVTVTLTASNPCGISVPVSKTINIFTPAPPLVSISSDDLDNTVCSGTPVVFTASPVNSGVNPTYQWKLNGVNVGINSNTLTESGLKDGDQVMVEMTSVPAACSSVPVIAISNTIKIQVLPNPTPAIAGSDQADASTCGLTSVTLAGNMPLVGVGTWSIVSGTGGSITNPSSPASTFSGLEGASYILRWTISSGTTCPSSSDEISITFNQPPTLASAGPDQTDASTCGTTSVTLAANTAIAGVGVWSIVSGSGGAITNLSSPTSTFSGIAGSSYTLRWTIANGGVCSETWDEVDIIFNQNPIVDPGPLLSDICSGSSTAPMNGTISGGATNAVWSGGIGTWLNETDPAKAVYSSSSAETGLVILTLTANSLACGSASLTKTILINPLPASPTINVVHPDCNTSTGSVELSGLPAGNWILNPGNISGSGNTTTLSNLASLNYNLSVTDNNGCISAPVNFTVNPVPVTPAQPVVNVLKQPDCDLSTGSVEVAIVSGRSHLYSLVNGTYQTSNRFINLLPGNYQFVVKDLNSGCTSVPSVIATIEPPPPLSPVPFTGTAEKYCFGDPSVQLRALGNNLLWYLTDVGGVGSSTAPIPSTTIIGTTTYFVTQRVGTFCESNRVPLDVIVHPLPVADAGPDKEVIAGNNIQLEGVASGNGIDILWSPGIGLSNAKIAAPFASPTETTTYTIEVKSADGCVSKDMVKVIVIEPQPLLIPNAFTPNGDGFNDRWIIGNIEEYPNAIVQVFNRFGTLVFETRGYTNANAWDGRHKQADLSTGVYYYIIRPNNQIKQMSGSVSIIR